MHRVIKTVCNDLACGERLNGYRAIVECVRVSAVSKQIQAAVSAGQRTVEIAGDARTRHTTKPYAGDGFAVTGIGVGIQRQHIAGDAGYLFGNIIDVGNGRRRIVD